VLGWKRQVVVLLYHHISDPSDDPFSLSGVEDGMPVDRLDLQLQSFTRWYRPCSATEFVSQIRRREAPSKDALLVTFDDAYLDNRQLAAACLRRHGVQGLIFVPSGYIESTCRFWWVRINDIIRCASKKSILEAHSALGDYPDVQQVFRQSNVDEWIGRRVLRARLAEILTRMEASDQQGLLDRLEGILGIAPQTCLPLLTWEDMRDMREDHFEFGAHTVSHPSLPRLTRSNMSLELRICADQMEQHLGYRPAVFAYPYGHYNEMAREEVHAAGYLAAFTANPGTFEIGRDALEVPRIQPMWSDRSKIITFVVLLKLSKYFPRLLQRILSRMAGEYFTVSGKPLTTEYSQVTMSTAK
jgi:peptidoglycan/xylan/chitin deacetylase (PgdA/CDA1 family)